MELEDYLLYFVLDMAYWKIKARKCRGHVLYIFSNEDMEFSNDGFHFTVVL